MEYSPPPLFKQGPSALARLIFFVVLAIALLISDARFSTLEIVRGMLGAGLYPLQRAALVPRDIFMGAADLAVTSATLRSENRKLSDKNLELSVKAGDAAQLAIENAHLRALLNLQSRATTEETPAEIQYDTRDPFTQKVVIGKGSQQNIQDGAPVVTEDGVIGQVTRVFPLQSEVTLLTDKDQAVPVQISRTGLRSVIYGTPKGDTLDLRFVPISADVQAGDELVTSGLDGIYPPGLPVAKVLRVDKQADTAFARVVCVPIAAVRGARQLLVLHYNLNQPPNPVEVEAAAAAKEAKENKGKKKPAPKAAAAAGASGASAPVPGSAPAAATPAAPAPAKPSEKAAEPKAASGAAAKPSKKAHAPKPASSGAAR
ncbi:MULTISPECIES: rod shape-determining protein MreC [Caballeronia]|jgi:rod shape-determining protein MreC|uniref:Cell shape-determining protein MreC n=1 Tax=Caballeronia zhejiangensis TaxID=871203 RepID=A0A656QTY7_9BURK|nr:MULTISPECIES: rod shape-determining protein MreC [Caballeronia]KDR32850.1 rod shape-determining protein MreC [Caballeronia zhejiangensis]MCG7399634.1 rod shape-determining protein MreC [Caballeronia zhejiangensis]MCI1041843.1 rod shape-determining protein MreC [Caballeronia zhejiangensis]MDR5763864.1 rod shape-determining protein MreC [Caballeronia sp. LZ028]